MHGDLMYVLDAIEASSPDVLLCCGDWGDPGFLDPDVFQAILNMVPVLSVFGNHDDLSLLSAARNRDGTPVLLEQGVPVERGGLTFAGISGIWARSHRKEFYVTDEDVAEYSSRLAGRGVDVLLSHGCPIGLADALPGGLRGGQRCFLDAFHLIQPRLYLCGHLHFPQKRVLKDGRIVVNVGYTWEGDYWTFDVTSDGVACEYHRLAGDR